MKKILIAGMAAAVLGVSGPAGAADLPTKGPIAAPAPIFNWSGFYVGVNGGWLSESYRWTYTNPVPFIPPHKLTQDQGILGAHLGYQHQWQQIVVGVELAGSFPASGDYATFVPCVPAVSATSQCQARMRSLWTIGGRLGWTGGPWLIYGTAGWAQASGVSTRELTFPPTVFDFSRSRSHNGYYFGVGADYMVNNMIIVGLEYQHVELQTRYHASDADAFSPSPPGVNGRNIRPVFDIIRARLSLKFGT